MRAALLLAVALALGGIAMIPTASAVCSTGDAWVDDTCAATICTIKSLKGPWIHTCWGIVGPPP